MAEAPALLEPSIRPPDLTGPLKFSFQIRNFNRGQRHDVHRTPGTQVYRKMGRHLVVRGFHNGHEIVTAQHRILR